MRATITKHTKRYEELLTTVKKRKLQGYDHVTRASGLSKTVLQATVQGGRRRGRQKKKWTDNIAEWTVKSFAMTQALAHDQRLGGLVVKASASGAEYPGFESRLRRDSSGSSHTSDFKIGTPVATLPGAWRYRVSAGTGRPGVSIL